MKYLFVFLIVVVAHGADILVINSLANPIVFGIGDGNSYVGAHGSVIIHFTADYPATQTVSVIDLGSNEGTSRPVDLYALGFATTSMQLERLSWSVVVRRLDTLLNIADPIPSQRESVVWAAILCFSCGLYLGWIIISPLEVM